MGEKILIKSKKNMLIEWILKVFLIISIIAFLFLFFVVGEFIYDHEFGFVIALTSPALVIMIVCNHNIGHICLCKDK